jgi:hypothetical protein
MRLEPPSIRASRCADWAPNTAYARGVTTTGDMKRPRCQNGGAVTRSLHGRFNQLALSVCEIRVLLWRPAVSSAAGPDPQEATTSGGLRSQGGEKAAEGPQARLASLLDRFQSRPLRHRSGLEVAPQRNE